MSSRFPFTLPIIGLIVLGGALVYGQLKSPTGDPDTRDNAPPPPLTTMAWIYPHEPGCNAPLEYTDGRAITVLKAEFFTLEGGTLSLLSDENTTCNGYSTSTIAALKAHSQQQYATVSSANVADMEQFFANELDSGIATLTDFVVANDITGVEINFEDFGNWTPDLYRQYKNFITKLGTALHQNGKQLMLDGPAVSNATEEAEWYLWRYSDFTSLPVDHMVVMAYDYQYDYGAGTPVAPLDWIQKVITFVSSKYPKEKLTIGLPSYGYEGRLDTYDITILTEEQIKTKPGYTTAVRDASSSEMTWQNNGLVYFYQDAESLAAKRTVVQNNDIHSISVWHLGGNPWFTP